MGSSVPASVRIEVIEAGGVKAWVITQATLLLSQVEKQTWVAS